MISVAYIGSLSLGPSRSVSCPSSASAAFSCVPRVASTVRVNESATRLARSPGHTCRILQRPVEADPYLKNILVTWVRGHGSMASIIDNSRQFSQKFAELLAEDGESIGALVRNLGVAHHRFESIAKPFARLCYGICAVAATANHISVTRQNRAEGKSAREWLSQLNNESYLQAAMMADAAQEDLHLLRFTDDEMVDSSEVQGQIGIFLDRLEYLFGPSGGCVKSECLTRHALRVLERPKIFHVGRETRQLGDHGGVSESVIKKCLARMQPWLILVKEVCQAEFPSFELLTCMRVFALPHKCHIEDSGDLSATQQQDLARMAQAYGVDRSPLESQFQKVRPIAKQFFKDVGCTSLEAWVRAYNRCAQVRHIQRDALKAVLVQAVTFSASTSGVERNFATKCRTLSERQRGLSENSERDLLKVVVDRVASEEAEVIARAREVWAELYGEVRQPKQVCEHTLFYTPP